MSDMPGSLRLELAGNMVESAKSVSSGPQGGFREGMGRGVSGVSGVSGASSLSSARQDAMTHAESGLGLSLSLSQPLRAKPEPSRKGLFAMVQRRTSTRTLRREDHQSVIAQMVREVSHSQSQSQVRSQSQSQFQSLPLSARGLQPLTARGGGRGRGRGDEGGLEEGEHEGSDAGSDDDDDDAHHLPFDSRPDSRADARHIEIVRQLGSLDEDLRPPCEEQFLVGVCASHSRGACPCAHSVRAMHRLWRAEYIALKKHVLHHQDNPWNPDPDKG